MSPATNFSSSSSSSSSRWCPTPEQLMILEEMYKAGIRTPNSSQIQHITAQLSYYGRIEGKNVFYWFQNHKARDRQKLRRKICKQLQQQKELYLQNNYHNHHLHRQPELMLNQQSLLGFLPLPAASLLHQHHSSPPPFFPQVGGEDAFMHSHTWKVHHEISAERAEMEKKLLMNMYGHDWMMTMMDVGPTNSSPSCHSSSTGSGATNTTRAPLKTLQLFPVTSTNLKAADDEEEEESRPYLETM